MKISEMIEKLQAAQDTFGDLPVATFDGEIVELRVRPTNEGCALKFAERPDEINLEIICHDH